MGQEEETQTEEVMELDILCRFNELQTRIFRLERLILELLPPDKIAACPQCRGRFLVAELANDTNLCRECDSEIKKQQTDF